MLMFVNPTTILLRTYAPAPLRARERTRAPHVRAERAPRTDEPRESPARRGEAEPPHARAERA